MGIPIAELQERISSHDFAEYWAMFQLEPWGLEREDYRAGIVASTVANANRDRKKHPRPYRPEDFVPHVAEREGDDDDELDEDEALAHASGIDAAMAAFGGDDEPESFRVRKGEPETSA